MEERNVIIELIIKKSKLLTDEALEDNDLEVLMNLMMKDSQLNLTDIFDLIVKENVEQLYKNFGTTWTFIDKYDFDNKKSLKDKYEKYRDSKVKIIDDKIEEINKKSDNEIIKINKNK